MTPQGGSDTPAAPQLNAAEQAAVAAAQAGIQQPDPNNPAPPQGTPAAPQRPDYIPEKFWDAEKGEANLEGLAKSYAELEKSRGEAPKDEPAGKQRADGKVEKAVAEAAAEAAGGDSPELQTAVQAASQQFAENGEIGDDAYAALEKAGLPRDMVDLYVAGLEAQTREQMGQLHSLVEGADNYNAMIDWAAKNLDDAGIDAFNNALDNPSIREFAVRDLYSKFSNANPSEGKLTAPAGGQAGAQGDVYKSMDDLVNAQMDDRYGTDSAYTQQVQDKVQRSVAAGIQLAPQQRFAPSVHTFE